MIADIENGIVARLNAASDGGYLGYKYRTKETYPTDWDAYLTKAIPSFPAYWVTFGGWTPVGRIGNGVQVEAQFGVVVAAQNLRNESATRHGGVNETVEPGSYQMIMDVVGLLHGSCVGLDAFIEALEVGALQFVAATPLMLQHSISMMAVHFSTRFTLQPDDFDMTGEFAGDLATFNVKWDLPPFTAAPRPDDWVPDAEDQISLPLEETPEP